MKEIDCAVSSTWSVCEKVRAEALRKDRKEELSQLDYIIGPMRRNDEVYIHNARRLWATWDHCPFFARRRTTCQSLSEKEKMDAMEADNRRAIITSQKESYEKRERHGRRFFENAAKKIQHRTNAQK